MDALTALTTRTSQGALTEPSAFLKVPATQTVKTLIVRGQADDKGHYGLVALVLRGDHELNEIKAEKLAQVGAPLTRPVKPKC